MLQRPYPGLIADRYRIGSRSALKVNSSNTTFIDDLASDLVKRQCEYDIEAQKWICDFHFPTITDMVTKMRDKSQGGRVTKNKSVFFYTNLRKPTADELGAKTADYKVHYAWAAGWMRANKKPGYAYASSIKGEWFKTQEYWMSDHKQDMDLTDLDPNLILGLAAPDIFVYCYMQALAEAAINPTAYLFTPKGQYWAFNSVWAKIEYWKLTRNPNIQQILRVDPTPGACDSGEVLWQRGRDAEVAPRWQCPILEKPVPPEAPETPEDPAADAQEDPEELPPAL